MRTYPVLKDMNKYTDISPQIWCKHSRRAERKPRRGEATKSAARPDPLGRGGNHNGSYADGAFCLSSHAKYSGIDTRRRPGFSIKAAHPLARQTRRALRRQIPHHRFSAVQLPQFRHPPHRGAHAIQGAFADPPHPAGLGISARRTRRVRRAGARAAARENVVVYRHRRRRVSESRHHPQSPPQFVLVLAGDHIYKMDYNPMLAYHVAKGADLTIGAIEVPVDYAKAFGVMAVDNDWRVTSFAEKPDKPAPIPGHPDTALASMGTYIFNTLFHYEQLIRDSDTSASSHDFGKDIIPRAIDKYRDVAYPFRDDAGEQAYWRDVGTGDAFWEANMELIGVSPELNLYDTTWPSWTYQAQLPPAKFVFDDEDRRGMAVDSMVSGGCIISGARGRHSLLFSNVRIDAGSAIEDCVVLPDVEIGRNCRLRMVVVDKFCRIPDGTVIGEDPEEDAKRYYVTQQGVVLVIPEMLGDRRHYVR